MKPWLWLPPHLAHDLSPMALRFYGLFAEGSTPVWKSRVWRHLVFKNPLGIAGGVDKNAESLRGWWALGAGFIEVGTVTPRPQDPNPGRIMDRHLPSASLWNRMGFPSEGAEEVLGNLRAHRPFRTPIFINIGKNRSTPNEEAGRDYLELIRTFAGHGDAGVVNISSPNTKGLRDLQQTENFKKFLEPLINEAQKRNWPLLIKLSPDMETHALAESVNTATEMGIDGFVLTNTTLSRFAGSPYPSEGGVSGAPLRSLSLQALKTALHTLGDRRTGKLIISVGGVMTAEDVFERLSLGADLVQVYSALILEGPGFFRKVAQKV